VKPERRDTGIVQNHFYRSRLKPVTAAACLFVVIFVNGAATIDFETIPGMDNAIIPVPVTSQLSDQFLSSGVKFTSGSPYVAVVALGEGHAVSGLNAIGGTTPDGLLSYDAFFPIVATFFDPQNPAIPGTTDFVSLRLDLDPTSGASVTLNAFDLKGQLVDSFTALDGDGVTLQVAGPGIHSVQFVGTSDEVGAAIDDFTFNPVVPFAVTPRIITQPADQVAATGASATFSISASGTPLLYQWRRDGIDIANATNATFALTNAQFIDVGGYTAVATNLIGSVTSRVAQLSVAEGRVYTNARGARLPYRLFLPDNYNPSLKYPLILFWHGIGEAGTNNTSQLRDNGQFVFLSALNRARHPCFFVAPQIWTASANCVDNLAIIDQGAELLNLLKTEFSIDPDRVYVTGLSHGGFYTWIFPARFPDLVAAAVPMSAGWLCHTNFLNINVPIWNFHAADDGTVAVANSDTAVASLRNVGRGLIYTRYPSGGHGIWPKAYNTPTLVDWLMAQKRGEPSKVPPLVNITTNVSFITTLTNVSLSGTASHYSNVLQVRWTNTANRVSGKATGTDPWSITNISLRPDTTNTLIVTASGTSYTPDLSTTADTTFNSAIQITHIPLRIGDLTVSSGNQSISFTWRAESGETYRVQYKNDLNDPDWIDLPTLPTIDGSTASIVDIPNTAAQRFYRAVQTD
jgi:poly(3-hydroxybutyrate) depolymerase